MADWNESPPEPTSEQCSANAPMEWAGGKRRGFATYRYPQMGGYAARAVVEIVSATVAPPRGLVNEPGIPSYCFDVWIWHDGDFPFAGDNADWEEDPPRGSRRGPICLHHCDAGQFIAFGQLVAERGADFLTAESAKGQTPS